MNFELDEDTLLFRDSVRELGKHRADAVRDWESARSLPSPWLGELGELGLLAMQVPEAEGGAGLSTLAAMAVLQELGRFSASTAVTVAVHNVLGLGVGASAEQKTVVGFARGLQASRAADGVTVQGTDAAAFGVASAPRLVVFASLEGTVRPFLVSRDATVRGQSSRTLGLRAADIGSVTFEGAPATPLDGDAGRAWQDFGLSLGFIAAGIGRAALAEGTAYALERQQFGRPIAKFQAIQWKLADLATGLDAAELMLGIAAGRTDDGRAAAVGRAVLAATTAASAGCSDMLQVHGGYGYTQEYPIERLYRDARAVALYAGVREATRTTVADAITARYAG